MIVTTIYGLFDSSNPELIRYIGKAINPKERLLAHISKSHQPGYKNNWIRNVLSKNGTIGYVVLATGINNSAANFLESLYIELYKNLGYSLTNLTTGGDGRFGFTPSRESIEKTASAHRGRKRSIETCQRISAAKIGVKTGPRSEEFKEKIRAVHIGSSKPYMVERNKQPWTEERRKKQSESQKKRWEKVHFQNLGEQ